MIKHLIWNVAAVDNDGFEEELEHESNIPDSEPPEKSEENEGDVDLGKEIDKLKKNIYIFKQFVNFRLYQTWLQSWKKPESNFTITTHG